MAAAKRKRNGRQWTRQELSLFDRMLEAGATRSAIAKALNCSPSTLDKHFGTQLKGRHKRGRRARSWSVGERDLVALVAGLGIGHAEIATMLGLSTGEFQAAFAEDLVGSKARVDAAIAAAIFVQALAGDGVLLRFYARAKMGWNDRHIPDAPPADDEADLLRRTIDQLDAEGRKAYRLVLEQLGARSRLSAAGPGPGDTVQ